MNFLAHCYLSCSDEDLLLGNLITDFMRKSEENNYSGQVLDGILLHRKIDSYTDSHEASLMLRQLLRPRHGKYAPVVVDLIWDYLLCQHWRDYSSEQLAEFVKPIYQMLLNRKKELPIRLRDKIDSMVDNDFILAYKDVPSMMQSLQWMDTRVNFPSDFVAAIEDINENHEYISKLFKKFFPELISFVDEYCGC